MEVIFHRPRNGSSLNSNRIIDCEWRSSVHQDFWDFNRSFGLSVGSLWVGGLCLRIGKGLVHPLDEAQPWLRVKRGGIVLGLMIIFPILGWVFVLPVAILTGIGAAFLGWRDSKKVSDE